jgi:hypothetical protein
LFNRNKSKILYGDIFIVLIIVIIITFGNFSSLSAQDRKEPPPKNKQKQYTIEQATSERAQLHTVAFNGLAFITGSFGADCFFPPGKVADFFGFQYMRDNDKNEKGHNTNFLTRIANNVLSILNDEQLVLFKELAKIQAPIYDEFAYKRMVLINAFRRQLEGDIPEGKKELSKEEVIKFCSKIYDLDAELSYNRAIITGRIISHLFELQKEKLAKLNFSNSSTWPDLPETLDKKSMTHREHVCVMTYASEFFSWYAGTVTSDVYFCPERHGTYFGGFFLKDYPAMGNRDYSISTSLTGDKGKDFMDALTPEQSDLLKQVIKMQEPLLKEIINVRTAVSVELRETFDNEPPDKDTVYALIKRYGELDSEMSYNYAMCFAKINKSLTPEQKEKLVEIRGLDVIPKGTYLFSDPVDLPKSLNTDFLFK